MTPFVASDVPTVSSAKAALYISLLTFVIGFGLFATRTSAAIQEPAEVCGGCGGEGGVTWSTNHPSITFILTSVDYGQGFCILGDPEEDPPPCEPSEAGCYIHVKGFFVRDNPFGATYAPAAVLASAACGDSDTGSSVYSAGSLMADITCAECDPW
jgi:hypothetical protein